MTAAIPISKAALAVAEIGAGVGVGVLQSDGRVLREMYLREEPKDKYDLCKLVASVPSEDAFHP